MSKINKTSAETRLAIVRRSAAMLPDRPTQAGLKPWDIRNALFTAIIADKGACLMGEIDRIVDETNAAIDAMRIKSGTLTVPTNRWKGEETPRAECAMGSLYTAGCAVLFIPEDDETKEQARIARLSMAINETLDGEWSDLVVFVGEGGDIPSVDLHFRYIVIPTESKADAIVALVGVDAYGEDGGGVDEDAVKKIINSMLGNVDNVRQYSAANPPPYPVTSVNGHSGAVNLNASDVGARPSTWMPTAADVGADPAETAERKTAALRQEVNTQLVAYDKSTAVNNKISTHNTSPESHADLRLELQRLADRLNAALNSDDTSLDEFKEIVAYIKSNKTLIDGITASKVNVKDIVDNLVTNKSNVPLSAAQGVALKLLIDNLDAIVQGKVTAEQLSAAVEQALTTAKESGDFDGRRGYAILRVTSSTTSSSGTGDTGAAIKYKIELANVREEAGVDEVLVGDTVLRASVYMYPVVKVDASYVYLGAYTSIKGNPGTSVTISSVTESDESGGINEVVFSDGKTLSVKNGKTPSNIADLEAAEYIEVIGEDSAGVQYSFKFLGQEVTT